MTVMPYARLQSSTKRLLHSELSCEDGMDMLHASDGERNATTVYVKSGDENKRRTVKISAQKNTSGDIAWKWR
jgi:hypothetical protein